MAEGKVAEKWASNAAQWIRTALTNVYHAMGQAEIGHKPSMVEEMKMLAATLEAQEKKLQLKYNVPPATGVGRARKTKKTAKKF